MDRINGFPFEREKPQNLRIPVCNQQSFMLYLVFLQIRLTVGLYRVFYLSEDENQVPKILTQNRR